MTPHPSHEDLLGYPLSSLCIKHVDNGGICTHDGAAPAWHDCPTLSEVYNVVKWTASDRAYQQFLERQEK